MALRSDGESLLFDGGRDSDEEQLAQEEDPQLATGSEKQFKKAEAERSKKRRAKEKEEQQKTLAELAFLRKRLEAYEGNEACDAPEMLLQLDDDVSKRLQVPIGPSPKPAKRYSSIPLLLNFILTCSLLFL